ncbi:MCE family protein [[Mycobacterium] burgundiense]|uniref:MCE family protein n=1 Tax=[Mycobacterium] burgundiense TaxID=3064286 RepID=A0ABM9M6E3_9MYCO|nr:MCE family protein [Mycolicibacterium sp. MU0053]CAJ1510760.1 MCE family protein [Mycolicibacterium sp. MU0053]
MTWRSRKRALAVGFTLLLAASLVVAVGTTYFRPTQIVIYFTSVTGIYPGDDARVLGVKVGKIAAVDPAGAHVKMTVDIDADVPIPADARAVIVAQSLVSSRYVQLAPAYETSGPTMRNGAVIPVERTAVPVEWDEVKTQLMRLATELAPSAQGPDSSLSRFIDSAADAMQGNGEKLHRTLEELSGVGRILADGGGNIVEVIRNLQTFVSTLRDSNVQIVEFQNRFATLTSVLSDSRSALDGALTDLSNAVGDVQRFVAGTGAATTEQLERLTDVTQVLVDQKADLENVLHVMPNAIANSYNVVNPNTGTQVGSFVINNFSDTLGFICNAIAAVTNVTSEETARLCRQYLGPALRLPNFNYLPIPINPYLSKAGGDIIYTDPSLAPGGTGANPPEPAPSISAYTGAIDNPFPAPQGAQPPAVAPGPGAPAHLPAAPAPALYPGAPVPAAPSVGPALPELILPAQGAL